MYFTNQDDDNQNSTLNSNKRYKLLKVLFAEFAKPAGPNSFTDEN